MLAHTSWLTGLGLALVLLSGYASDRQPKSAAFWVWLPFVVFCLIYGSRAFSRTPPHWWYVAVLVGVWFWEMIREFRRWGANRKQGT